MQRACVYAPMCAKSGYGRNGGTGVFCKWQSPRGRMSGRMVGPAALVVSRLVSRVHFPLVFLFRCGLLQTMAARPNRTEVSSFDSASEHGAVAAYMPSRHKSRPRAETTLVTVWREDARQSRGWRVVSFFSFVRRVRKWCTYAQKCDAATSLSVGMHANRYRCDAGTRSHDRSHRIQQAKRKKKVENEKEKSDSVPRCHQKFFRPSFFPPPFPRMCASHPVGDDFARSARQRWNAKKKGRGKRYALSTV